MGMSMAKGGRQKGACRANLSIPKKNLKKPMRYPELTAIVKSPFIFPRRLVPFPVNDTSPACMYLPTYPPITHSHSHSHSHFPSCAHHHQAGSENLSSCSIPPYLNKSLAFVEHTVLYQASINQYLTHHYMRLVPPPHPPVWFPTMYIFMYVCRK